MTDMQRYQQAMADRDEIFRAATVLLAPVHAHLMTEPLPNEQAEPIDPAVMMLEMRSKRDCLDAALRACVESALNLRQEVDAQLRERVESPVDYAGSARRRDAERATGEGLAGLVKAALARVRAIKDDPAAATQAEREGTLGVCKVCERPIEFDDRYASLRGVHYPCNRRSGASMMGRDRRGPFTNVDPHECRNGGRTDRRATPSNYSAADARD